MKRAKVPPWIPPWTTPFWAPLPAPVNPIDERRRDYILLLVRVLDKHITESGALDEAMADHIEALMHKFWPNDVPAPAGVAVLDGQVDHRADPDEGAAS